MTFNSTAPYLKAVGAPVCVGVVKIGQGAARCGISLSASMLEELGSPEKCNVFIGDDEDEGQILIQCDDDGLHDIRLGKKGGGRISLNAFAGMPKEARKRQGVRHVVGESEEKIAQLTLHLPW